MGPESIRRGDEESDREIARRKNILSDISRILVAVAFSLFIIGFSCVTSPVTTATICWILALLFFLTAAALSAVNHFK